MVEILFTKGLIKILFATETFAMGVNAPAKAVVFSGIRKHDGESFRELLPGEYTQMSGRAGRRGLDDTGVVIIACSDEVPDQSIISRMVLGTPTKLQSQFRLTYNMILNLLRVEALKVEDMIKRSFSENVSQKLLPEQEQQLGESTRTLKAFKGLNCNICNSDIHEYYDISAKIMMLTHELREMIVATPVGSKSLVPGRVVMVNNMFYRNTIGVILASKGMNASRLGDAKSYSLFLLDHKDRGQAKGTWILILWA
jgi:antiviral helicase SKI2